jgi:hypothetical protein
VEMRPGQTRASSLNPASKIDAKGRRTSSVGSRVGLRARAAALCCSASPISATARWPKPVAAAQHGTLSGHAHFKGQGGCRSAGWCLERKVMVANELVVCMQL